MDTFQNMLLGFAAVALFVSAFFINNTFSIVVGQRTRQLALLRSLGASRRQITRSVVVEALFVGVLASVVGIGFGLVIAIGLQATSRPPGSASPTRASCSPAGRSSRRSSSGSGSPSSRRSPPPGGPRRCRRCEGMREGFVPIRAPAAAGSCRGGPHRRSARASSSSGCSSSDATMTTVLLLGARGHRRRSSASPSSARSSRCRWPAPWAGPSRRCSA